MFNDIKQLRYLIKKLFDKPWVVGYIWVKSETWSKHIQSFYDLESIWKDQQLLFFY